MKKFDGYMAGVNLGGWLSQFRGNLSRDPEHHFDRFITRADIDQIASWGMDHVRLPFDSPLFEEPEKPFSYLEEGFRRMDDCLRWCKEAGLNLILDMHEAPGFAFGSPESNTLFDSPAMQERYVALWTEIARRYQGEGKNLTFELLNEVVERGPERWNLLAGRVIRAIREVSADRTIVVGGIQYNSVNALKDMPIFQGPDIVYTFHMYEPFCLTHQHASWGAMKNNPGTWVYPSETEPYLDYFADPFYKGSPQDIIIHSVDRVERSFMERYMQPAYDFMAEHNIPLYCGEYGVIQHADMDTRVAWVKDMGCICTEHGIARAIWSYRGMSFPLVDAQGKPLSGELVAAAAFHG